MVLTEYSSEWAHQAGYLIKEMKQARKQEKYGTINGGRVGPVYTISKQSYVSVVMT